MMKKQLHYGVACICEHVKSPCAVGLFTSWYGIVSFVPDSWLVNSERLSGYVNHQTIRKLNNHHLGVV